MKILIVQQNDSRVNRSYGDISAVPLQTTSDAEGSKGAHLATCAAYFLRSFRIGLGADFWRSSTAISSIKHKYVKI